jgi:hypothetical protein
MIQESFNLREQVVQAGRNLVDSVVTAAPRVVTGIVLVIVALIVAKLLEKIFRRMLVGVRLDGLVERIGLDRTLRRMGVRQEPSRVLARVAYFLLLFLFARTAADALGLDAVSNAMGSFLGYVPNLVAAVLILVVGGVAGQFAGKAVAQAAKGSGIDFGASLGSVTSALVLFIAGVMAVSQLRFDTDIVRIVTICSLAGMALAFGLSFGLGSRDVTRNIIAGFYARKVFRVGKEIEIRGERGILRAVTPTQTLLEKDEKTIAVANSAFLDDVVRQ